MDIQHTLQQIANGNRQAFASVVTHFQRPLFGYLGRMGLPQAQAEDIAQETFLRVWQNLGQYDPKQAAFSTWLFTIARRLALNALARASTKLETSPTPSSSWDEGHEEIADTQTPSVLERMEQQEQQQRLQQALRRLPPHERSTLALAYIQGLDVKTIARIEACSESAVKVRLHRAREQLRQSLGVSS